MKTYESVRETRTETIDGVSNWDWIKTEYGAWNIIKNEWVNSHKVKYFEHVRAFDVVVQAGGNCGMYPRLLAQYFKTVYTFEPDPLNFFYLVLNCQENNIIKQQAALGDTRSMISINRRTMHNVGMHQVETQENSRIPCVLLDDYALPKCDLICLDVEGYEQYAIRGALKTIDKFRPVIAAENGNEIILDMLKPFGYEVVDKSGMDTIYATKMLF